MAPPCPDQGIAGLRKETEDREKDHARPGGKAEDKALPGAPPYPMFLHCLVATTMVCGAQVMIIGDPSSRVIGQFFGASHFVRIKVTLFS